jgi:predicted dehydrogenase
MNPHEPTHRRSFLKQSAGYAAGLWLVGSRVRDARSSPAEKLNVGVIGVGGRGSANLGAMRGENVVALCDVDEGSLGNAARQFPAAKTYHDFRKLLEQKNVDAVVVSTPDHTHAAAALRALRMRKHVYCEKPLTHSVDEARQMAAAAVEARVATQMGNGGHSSDTTRRVVELVRAGAIGKVTEVHAWTNRPIWPQGIAERPPAQEVPNNLHWDLWIGPAPERPFNAAYHPFKWRGWWDFGTGALGDMGCHIIDPAYWALGLRDPVKVEAESAPVSVETAPSWSIVRYTFPATRDRGPVTLVWYDGGKFPPAELFDGEPPREGSSGSILVGTKGRIDADRPRLLPRKDFEGFKQPEPTIPRSPGHHEEWIEACKTGKPTGTSFDYSGPLTELMLLGNVALRAGHPIEWDAQAMRVKNVSVDDLFIRREPRKGWAL